jgi:hypothetical protein
LPKMSDQPLAYFSFVPILKMVIANPVSFIPWL